MGRLAGMKGGKGRCEVEVTLVVRWEKRCGRAERWGRRGGLRREQGVGNGDWMRSKNRGAALE